MLSLVKSAKLAGLSLTQIKSVLAAATRGATCERVIPLLDEKVEEIDGAIRALQTLRGRLVRALKKGIPKKKKGRSYSCSILEGIGKAAQQ